MAKNLTNFEDFREKKSVNESSKKITEAAQGQAQVDSIPIVKMINFPLALVKSFIKKVLDETGKDIVKGGVWSDDLIARTLVDYTVSSLMIIENFPISIATGNAESQKAQSAQVAQPAAQIAQPPVQQVQAPPVQGGQGVVQSPPAQLGNAQQTAQAIPPTE